MKKSFFILFFVIISLISFAQVNSTHMTFKGVPIDGTLQEYTQLMKQKGFTHLSTQEGVAMLKGDFAAYKDCIIGVATLKQRDLVSKITVIFPDCDRWSSLASNYFSLKEMLTEKYGEPVDCMEIFQSGQPDNDNSKIYEVQFDRCKYYTIYKTEDGNIELSIGHNGVISCYVILNYFDRINSNVIRQEAMNDL